MTLIELFKKFPDDQTAEKFFVKARWPNGITCAHCNSPNIKNTSDSPLPYRCKTCYKFFSVKVNTVMHGSRIGYQKWAIALYLLTNHVKGIPSTKLAKELGITQKTAWYLAHRIREGWKAGVDKQTGQIKKLSGPVEVDETYVGGKERNKHASKKLNIKAGTAGKIPVLGLKDRHTKHITGQVLDDVDQQKDLVRDIIKQYTTKPNPDIYTDGSKLYNMSGINRSIVYHSRGNYVVKNTNIHTNGIESFWAIVKRNIIGIYHKTTRKHLARYMREFAGKYNNSGLTTIQHMRCLVKNFTDKRLTYKQLIA